MNMAEASSWYVAGMAMVPFADIFNHKASIINPSGEYQLEGDHVTKFIIADPNLLEIIFGSFVSLILIALRPKLA